MSKIGIVLIVPHAARPSGHPWPIIRICYETYESREEDTMKRFFKLVTTITIVVVLSACTTIDAPYAVTDNPVGSKVGQSSGSLIFGFGDVDASLRTAASNGGITEISTVDFEIQQVLGFLFVNFTTTVTGE